MSLYSYCGGTVVAMMNEDSVCMVTDLRQGQKFLLLSDNTPKVNILQMNTHMLRIFRCTSSTSEATSSSD